MITAAINLASRRLLHHRLKSTHSRVWIFLTASILTIFSSSSKLTINPDKLFNRWATHYYSQSDDDSALVNLNNVEVTRKKYQNLSKLLIYKARQLRLSQHMSDDNDFMIAKNRM